MMSLFRSIFAVALATGLLMAGEDLAAQEVGGYAGAYLRRAEPARESAMGGVFVPFGADGSAIFGSGAALTGLKGRTAILSATALPLNQTLVMGGAGMPIGDQAGGAIGVIRYGLNDVAAYNARGEAIGKTSSSDLAVSLAGGMRIGPGSIGAAIRYLRFDVEGIAEGTAGYTVDLSGSVEFPGAFTGNDRIITSAALNNIAGELQGAHELVPANLRFGAAYLLPFEGEQVISSRTDPSGIVATRSLQPRTYLLLAAEMRFAQFDPLPPMTGLAAEWVPTPLPFGLGFGLRAGWNTRTGLAGGFFLNLVSPDLRLDFGAHPDYGGGDVASTVTLGLRF